MDKICDNITWTAASEESISVLYLRSVIVNIKKFKLPVNGKLDWHERMGMFTG